MRRYYLIDAEAHFAGGANRIAQRASADLSRVAGPVGRLAGTCCEKPQQ